MNNLKYLLINLICFVMVSCGVVVSMDTPDEVKTIGVLRKLSENDRDIKARAIASEKKQNEQALKAAIAAGKDPRTLTAQQLIRQSAERQQLNIYGTWFPLTK